MFQKLTPIKDRKIRFAMVGCGRISRKHLDGIRANENDCELVAACDSNAEALDTFTKETGAKGFSNLDSLLNESNADCVVLATPSGLHPEQAVRVASANKHVMTEKPMATRWKDGLMMVEACDNAGVQLFVVKQNRQNDTLRLLKQAVERKRFGRIFMVNLNVFWTRPQEYYDSSPWRGTWEFDGGAMMNQASHYIDLLDWLIGPVESVQAYTATLNREIQVEDSGVISVKWRSGALGSVNVTMLAYKQNFEGSITILGEKGTVRLGGVALNKIEHWDFKKPDPELDEKVKSSNYETDSVYGFGHPRYYRNVIETLQGKSKAETDGREGLKSLEVLIATYLSARDGKRVSLPLEY